MDYKLYNLAYEEGKMIDPDVHKIISEKSMRSLIQIKNISKIMLTI
jgi:hypothetical protein